MVAAPVDLGMSRQTHAAFYWKDTLLDLVPLEPGQTAPEPPEGVTVELFEAEVLTTPARGDRPDWDAARVFAMSALAHAFFVGFAWITPTASPFDLVALQRMTPRIHSGRFEPKKKEPPPERGALAGLRDAGRHKGAEGLYGNKKRPQKDAAASRTAGGRSDREIAESSGLLAIFRSAGSGLDTVLNGGGLGNGINETLGGLRGTTSGEIAGGAGGLGTRGTGPGGGGGSIGIGGLRFGNGRGRPGGANITLGNGGGRHVTPVAPGKVILSEGLKKHEISRVIRRNLARFRFCYEKQLQANPNLRGRVSVRFTIAPTGSVAMANVHESDIGSAAVDRCFVKVMSTLKFKQPRGGGVVVVTYPFVLDAA